MHAHKYMHQYFCFAYIGMYVFAQICKHAHKCVNVRSHAPHERVQARACVDNMRLSCLTSKILARSALWGYTLTGCLWWTTIYNNVKLTSSSWCTAGQSFNMIHPDARFVCRLIIMQLLSAPSGALSCCLLTYNSQGFVREHLRGADNCIW